MITGTDPHSNFLRVADDPEFIKEKIIPTIRNGSLKIRTHVEAFGLSDSESL
jgi:hypothetical protein